jgi:hypothetical protein
VKTQIIHLEPHDDLASVLDKVNWVKAERLILVWPGRNRVLTDKLDLRLIQRSVERRAGQIGIVSLDPDAQANASSLGIPVFEELDTLHAQNWLEKPVEKSISSKRSEDRADLYKLQDVYLSRSGGQIPTAIRITLFTLAIILVLVAFVSLIPSVEITVRPVREEYQEILSFPISRSSSQYPDYLRVDQVRVDGSVRIPTSGKTFEPGDFAQGVIEFKNLNDEVVVIPAGTTVRVPGSDELYFTTQSRITLLAEIDSSRRGEIVASLPGARGNVAAGQITAVDGQLGLLVSVQNPEATTGGKDVIRSAVSISDLNQSKAQLEMQLLAQARELMQANQLPTEELLLESLEIEELLSEQFDREVGDTADTVELKMDVVAQVLIVDLKALNQHVQENLSSSIASGKEIVPESLEIMSVQLSDPSPEGTMRLQVVASYELFNALSKLEIAKAVRGMQPLNAQRLLADEYPQNNFEIILRPHWFPLVPLFQPQVDVYYAWEGHP